MRGGKRRLTLSPGRRARATRRCRTPCNPATIAATGQLSGPSGWAQRPSGPEPSRRDRRAVCIMMRLAATLMSPIASRRPRPGPIADVSRSNFAKRLNCMSESSDLVGSKSGMARASFGRWWSRHNIAQEFFGAIVEVLGCRAVFAVETKESAGEADEKIVAIWGIRFSEDSHVDRFPVGR
jgi:hypothetical protein